LKWWETSTFMTDRSAEISIRSVLTPEIVADSDGWHFMT
jgi:hypothetical protein